MEAKPYISEICENSQISPKVVGEVSSPQNYASHVLPSERDLDIYKKYELFFTDKNKFHLNNNFDKNHCKIFLQEKEKCLENMNLDDHINDEISGSSKDYFKSEDKKEVYTNTINDVSNNDRSSNTNNFINSNENKTKSPVTINRNNKVFARNQSIVSNTNYNNITNLFDTGKGDLLSIILGFGK